MSAEKAHMEMCGSVTLPDGRAVPGCHIDTDPADDQAVESEQIAGHYCGQTQAHAAHVWQTPPIYGAMTFVSTYQCAGVTAEVLPGPCWHNSGVTWPGQNLPVRCELLAGHDGAHQAAGRAGGEAVWEYSAGERLTRPGTPTPEATP